MAQLRKRSPEICGVSVPAHWLEEIQRQAQEYWYSLEYKPGTERQQFNLINRWYREKLRAVYNDPAEFKTYLHDAYANCAPGEWKWDTIADYGRDIIRRAFNLPELPQNAVRRGRQGTGLPKKSRTGKLLRMTPRVTDSLTNLGKTYRFMSNSKETDGEIANKILQAGIDAKLQRLHAIKGATS